MNKHSVEKEVNRLQSLLRLGKKHFKVIMWSETPPYEGFEEVKNHQKGEC